MRTAKEAAEASRVSRDTNSQKLLVEVDRAITAACRDGKNEAIVSTTLRYPTLEEKIMALGYHITYGCGLNSGPYYTIRW